MDEKKREENTAQKARDVAQRASSNKGKSYRKEKLPELLKHLAAEFFQRELDSSSLVTITKAELSQNKKRVTIFFTVLPEEKELTVLAFFEKQRGALAQYVDDHARIGRMPEIKFSVDTGEKNRQRIDFLTQND